MSIRDDARQEAERRYPIRLPYNRDLEIRAREQKAFEAGAAWASEQAEAIDRMGPAAGCAYCVGAGGYEDYDGEWRECSCQRASRKPSADLPETWPFRGLLPRSRGRTRSADREPSDAEVEAAADAIVEASFGQELPEAPIDLARAALLAAQEVRRGD